MGGTIAIFDNDMQLLFGLGISQAGSNQQGWVISDGSYVESPVTRSEADWTYNYHPIWKEVNWNPWRWLEQADRIEITPEVLWELEGIKLAIEALPGQMESRSVTESGYWAATPENATAMISWMIVWAKEPKAKYIVCMSR